MILRSGRNAQHGSLATVTKIMQGDLLTEMEGVLREPHGDAKAEAQNNELPKWQREGF
jgi:hypothetical protein